MSDITNALSHPRLSLLIVHELSLAVRSFAGPNTAIELGMSWEARYLNKKHVSSSKNKGSKLKPIKIEITHVRAT